MNLKFRIVPNAMPASQGEAKYLGIIIPNGVRNRALMVKNIIAREHFSESTVNAVLDAAIAETEALCAEGRDVSWGPVKFISKMHGSFPYEDSAFEDGTASVTVDAEGTNALRSLFADVVPTPMSAAELASAIKVSNVMDVATEAFGEIRGSADFEVLGNGLTLDGEGEGVKLLDKKGIWWIEGSHLAGFSTGHWGAPAFVPHGNTNLTTSAAGAAALAKRAAELAKVIDAHGWRARWYQHVADEPSYHNVTNYRLTCGIVRKAMPGIRLTDAVESFDMGGALDAYCPKSYVYEQAKADYDLLKAAPTDELWCYTCCFPGGQWTNRLLDNELLRPVYLPWGCACFKLDGYLHWGFNQYGEKSNPFRQSCGMDMHLGSLLPPGDRNIVYPGKDGPWPSLRLEAMRQGFEDLELLKALAARDAAKAEKIRRQIVRGFGDYTADPKAYRAARRALLDAQ